MIFMAVGTQKFQLNRLLKEMDNLIEKQIIQEDVFAQIGESDYIPQNYKYERFINKQQFEEKISNCDILITHGGVGTIVAGLKNEKKVVVFPRLKKYAEHVDDHQLEIAEAFSQKNYVVKYDDGEDLGEVISECRNKEFNVYESERDLMISVIRNFLSEM